MRWTTWARMREPMLMPMPMRWQSSLQEPTGQAWQQVQTPATMQPLTSPQMQMRLSQQCLLWQRMQQLQQLPPTQQPGCSRRQLPSTQ